VVDERCQLCQSAIVPLTPSTQQRRDLADRSPVHSSAAKLGRRGMYLRVQSCNKRTTHGGTVSINACRCSDLQNERKGLRAEEIFSSIMRRAELFSR
jgi:hypothetical protein